MRSYPFRLGATSYVIPGDLVENAAYLADLQRRAGSVLVPRDMQLVLFDLPDGPSNLPDAATIAALRRVAEPVDLSYTVHLLADLSPPNPEPHTVWPESWQAARDVMARTLPLQPRAWVAHLDGAALRAANYAHRAQWNEHMCVALDAVGQCSEHTTALAVENLEGYPPDLVDAPVCAAGAGRCVDVGHLWLDGYDPLPYLEAAHEPGVIHLHGVAYSAARGRTVDHLPLDVVPPAQLDAVCEWLATRPFRGVVTLEVFGPEDFQRSLAAFQAAMARVAV